MKEHPGGAQNLGGNHMDPVLEQMIPGSKLASRLSVTTTKAAEVTLHLT